MTDYLLGGDMKNKKLEELMAWAADLKKNPEEWRDVFFALASIQSNVADWMRERHFHPYGRPKNKAKSLLTHKVRASIIADAGECAVCAATSYLEVDHVIPKRLGGTDERANLQVLCRACNGSKGGKTMRQWLGSGAPNEVAR